MAGVYQGQWADGDDNKDRGAFNFEPEFSFRPNDNNEIFAKFGFGAGNGLNGVSNFNLASWAANLEDDYTQVAEIYWRVVFNDYLAATADFQYMKDEFDTDEDEIEGIIGSIRVSAEF